jgi:hypothetical protein
VKFTKQQSEFETNAGVCGALVHCNHRRNDLRKGKNLRHNISYSGGKGGSEKSFYSSAAK